MDKDQQLLNFPNALSALRILMVPAFAAAYAIAERPGWALGVFIAAGATDMLDGHLARKYHKITWLGRLLDPLADKLMALTVMFCLCGSNIVPLWVPGALLLKELYMIIGATLLLTKRDEVVRADIVGKAATVVLTVAVCLLIPWHGNPVLTTAGRVLLYCFLVLTCVAAVRYTVIFGRKARVKKSNPPGNPPEAN